MNGFEIDKSLMIFDNKNENTDEIFKLRNPKSEADLIKLSLSNEVQIVYWG